MVRWFAAAFAAALAVAPVEGAPRQTTVYVVWEIDIPGVTNAVPDPGEKTLAELCAERGAVWVQKLTKHFPALQFALAGPGGPAAGSLVLRLRVAPPDSFPTSEINARVTVEGPGNSQRLTDSFMLFSPGDPSRLDLKDDELAKVVTNIGLRFESRYFDSDVTARGTNLFGAIPIADGLISSTSNPDVSGIPLPWEAANQYCYSEFCTHCPQPGEGLYELHSSGIGSPFIDPAGKQWLAIRHEQFGRSNALKKWSAEFAAAVKPEAVFISHVVQVYRRGNTPAGSAEVFQQGAVP